MEIGVVFPQTEIGTDPGAICAWAQAAEDLGFTHIAVFDHVLGANRATRPGWTGPYDHTDAFHEPLVLFGFLAAHTKRIGFATSILVLPQRETALVAKQVAEIDILTNGRLRLGVAAGWNDVEFEAHGRGFRNRGKRLEEQVEVMRLLWTKELVTFRGRWHKLTDVGINPLPIQQPIPIWFGGGADLVLRRVARIGDGWFANASPRMLDHGATAFNPDSLGRERISQLHAYTRAEHRDPRGLGVEVRIEMAKRSPGEAAEDLTQWRSVGATHVQLSTMRAGYRTVSQHIEAMCQFKSVLPSV